MERMCEEKGSDWRRQREELASILSSRRFVRAPALSRILTFVCERCFQGEIGAIKEYTVGAEGLNRGPGFDPGRTALFESKHLG